MVSELLVQVAEIVVCKHEIRVFCDRFFIPGFRLVRVPGAFQKIGEVITDVGAVRGKLVRLPQCLQPVARVAALPVCHREVVVRLRVFGRRPD